MQIGDMISFEKDGVIYTERVESVHYQSATPALYQRLNRFRRLIRRLTPARWRKSLLIRPAEPSKVTINDGSPVGKTLDQLERMRDMLDRLVGGR